MRYNLQLLCKEICCQPDEESGGTLKTNLRAEKAAHSWPKKSEQLLGSHRARNGPIPIRSKKFVESAKTITDKATQINLCKHI